MALIIQTKVCRRCLSFLCKYWQRKLRPNNKQAFNIIILFFKLSYIIRYSRLSKKINARKAYLRWQGNLYVLLPIVRCWWLIAPKLCTRKSFPLPLYTYYVQVASPMTERLKLVVNNVSNEFTEESISRTLLIAE